MCQQEITGNLFGLLQQQTKNDRKPIKIGMMIKNTDSIPFNNQMCSDLDDFDLAGIFVHKQNQQEAGREKIAHEDTSITPQAAGEYKTSWDNPSRPSSCVFSVDVEGLPADRYEATPVQCGRCRGRNLSACRSRHSGYSGEALTVRTTRQARPTTVTYSTVPADDRCHGRLQSPLQYPAWTPYPPPLQYPAPQQCHR